MVTQTRQAKTAQIFLIGLTVDDQDSAPGAWAFTTRYLTKQQLVSGCVPKHTSPGRMQVMSLLNALQHILDNYKHIELIINSPYIQKILKRDRSFQANRDLIQNIYDIIDTDELNIRVILVKPRLTKGETYFDEFGYLNSSARKQTHRAQFINERYSYEEESPSISSSSSTSEEIKTEG